METANELLRELQEIHDHFYSTLDDKHSKIDALVTSIDSILEASPEVSASDRFAIRGQAYNYYSQYDERAEEFLTSAIKRNPRNIAVDRKSVV